MLFTVPSRYWFPIGRLPYLALGRGRPGFPPDSACRMVLTLRQHPAPPTDRLRDSHPLRSPVPVAFGSAWAPRRAVGTPLPASRSTPEQQRAPARYAARVWAPPVSLAATPGILSSPQGTEMFQFPQCPPPSSEGGPADCPRGVAPFGYPWITRCQLVPRAFRGVAASFIGSRRLGIHHALIIVDRPRSTSIPISTPALPAPRSRPGPRHGAVSATGHGGAARPTPLS